MLADFIKNFRKMISDMAKVRLNSCFVDKIPYNKAEPFRTAELSRKHFLNHYIVFKSINKLLLCVIFYGFSKIMEY